MADLKSMKIDPKAREAKYAETVAADAPVFPYGLSLNLDEESIEKLGLDDLPEAGGKLMIVALVDVTNVGDRRTKVPGEKKERRDRSISLQITDLCLEEAPAKKKGAAETLYGG